MVKSRILKSKKTRMLKHAEFQTKLFNGVETYNNGYCRFKDWYKDGGINSRLMEYFLYAY